MKRIILSALCVLPMMAFGQVLLFNDGAMLKVEAGATLFVEGGIQNTASGTIDNDGIIELQGNFINAGTWEPSQPNTLKFSGNNDADITSGSAVFQTVQMAKGSGGDLTLLSNMTVNTNLDFNGANNKINTGNFDFKLGATSTVTGYDDDEYIATTGTGMVERTVTANGTFEFPIGDGTNYSPLTSVYTGSAYTAASLRARVNDLTHPNKPAASTDFISRYWDINASGITNYANTLTGTYVAGDLTGTASLVKGAVYDGTNWSYAAAAAGTNTVIGSTDDATADFTGTNFFGKFNVIALLDAAYGTGPNMTTNLNSGGFIPPNSPYADAPATVDTSLMPSDITDWVKVEFRDASNPATVLGKASAFLKNNGSIVGLDFTSLPVIMNGNPSSIISIYHRNHLPFRTDVGIDVVNPTLIDFSTDTTLIYNNASITSNSPLNFANSKWQMWSCDAQGATFFVNSTDFNFVKLQSTTQPIGYLRADVNLNGTANSTDFNLTKLQTTITKQAHL